MNNILPLGAFLALSEKSSFHSCGACSNRSSADLENKPIEVKP
jgi:hypothetical protein